jgi:hypothetical protein
MRQALASNEKQGYVSLQKRSIFKKKEDMKPLRGEDLGPTIEFANWVLAFATSAVLAMGD